ncbi:MAG: rRNA maturation RNase YbeY [Anaerolineae bacterium]
MIAAQAQPQVTLRCQARYRRPGRLSLIRKVALAAIAQTDVNEPVALSIVLTNDEVLHQLNQQFRGIDRATDVLSFGGDEFRDGKRRRARRRAHPVPSSNSIYIGDIVISMERCAEQARQGGHSEDAELALLVAHGVLHLLGYDHDTPARKARMWQTQARALAALGLTAPPTET